MKPQPGRTAAAATAAAAAGVAAAVTGAVVFPKTSTTSTPVDDSSSSSNSEGSIWQHLDPSCTAQMLGHIVLDAPQPGSISAGPDTVQVLLHLVPHSDLCQPIGCVPTDHGTTQHVGEGDVVHAQLGWREVVGAQVLRQQPHFVGVVLTRQEWEAWSDQQPVKLQELVTGALCAD